MNSFRAIVESNSNGQVVVATHNQDTIKQTSKIYNDSKSSIRVSYAQLLGLADHLTFQSKKDGFRVYKYLPWAQAHIMVGYMIRRA